MSKTYENLNVWKESVEFTSLIYKVTKDFPKSEIFGIVSQLRRAAVSVPCNIAEGSGRNSKKDFSRFIEIAVGSLNEVETLLNISFNLEYLSEKNFRELDVKIKELGNMLGGLKKYLQNYK